MTVFRRFADKGLAPALTVFLVSFALFAVTATPVWAQRVTAEPKLHVFGRFENASFSYLFLSFVFFRKTPLGASSSACHHSSTPGRCASAGSRLAGSWLSAQSQKDGPESRHPGKTQRASTLRRALRIERIQPRQGRGNQSGADLLQISGLRWRA